MNPHPATASPAPTRRSRLSWALYDWANSAFATTVLAGFFPLFFKQYWADGLSATASTFQLGLANSGASLVILVLAPLLGAVGDCGALRKRFLFGFAALGIAMTAALYFIGQGEWPLASAFFALGIIGFSGANVFYDSLLFQVAESHELDRVSALGYALGYLGGGLLFLVNVAMVLQPQWFALPDAATATRVAFLTVAIWWAVFSIPLALFVREPAPAGGHTGRSPWLDGWRQLRRTLGHIGALRPVVLFLVAYFLYMDGVDTLVRMALDYGLSIGLQSQDLIKALLLTQFIGFPAALAFGHLAGWIGARTGIFIAIGVYLLACGGGYFMDSALDFYLLAGTVGLVQGGIQALSRSFYARLIPRTYAAEFFGFYNMLGKFAAVIGPALMGATAVLTGDPRKSIFAVMALFIAGGLILARVPAPTERE